MDRPKMQPVVSTNIASVGYDKSTKELYVQFASNGATYRYENVAESDYESFLQASSPGEFFYANIRDQHRARRV
jgi:hypothetical protein